MVYSASAQTAGLAPSALQLPSPLLSSPVLSSPAPRASAQGYLGVLVGDVDTDTATRLKLKEARGAVVTLIDHDAPAAQAGVRVNDVVLEINGQAIGGAEQFTRILREMPAGRTISMIVCRDGAPHTVTVELADRKKMEHDVWKNLDTGADASGSAPVLGILPGASGDVPSGGFHNPFGGSALNVGAMVEPLAAQMAEYLGIQSGLMVKQVARKSEAANAGLKAFDIILKVGAESIATTADWDRALRANRNKTVQITVLRDRRQQVITLQVDSKRHRSALQQPPQAQQAEGLAPSA
ncbi:MAG TPA: PDZ domain-containing protein [Terracidiphilus sp.]|jgi:S1-C subfamily serine protease|nr:PDZ domain-containing protein [Terracidiphilus sp.]